MMGAMEATASERLLTLAAEHSLRAVLAPNAVFLAERLHASYPSERSARLLATAHLRAGDFSRAAAALCPAVCPENRYLYAVCCVSIGSQESLRDAEAHLRGVHGPIDVAPPAAAENAASTPGGAAGLYLLGSICQRTGRKDQAVSLYRRAVKANPTLWVAFEALANMGLVSSVDSVISTGDEQAVLELLDAQPQFGAVHSLEPSTPRRRGRALSQPAPHSAASATRGAPPPRYTQQQLVSNARQGQHVVSTDVTPQTLQSIPPQEIPDRYQQQLRHAHSYATPSPMPNGRNCIGMVTPVAPQAPGRGNGGATRRVARPMSSPPASTGARSRARGGVGSMANAADKGSYGGGGVTSDSSVRHPSELFATPPSGNQRSSRRYDGSGGRHNLQPSTSVVDVKAPQQVGISMTRRDKSVEATAAGALGAMDLIRKLGQITAELGRYRCSNTLALSNELPAVHKNSGFVLSLRGRAYLEMGNYAAAEREFRKSLELEPTRMDGIVEYYSTVLWHMKKELELAQLAIRAQRLSPVSSGAWCAAGNCFSLQRDADTALRFFKQATVASSTPNAYAYTLAGHEHVAKEDFEGALACYRQALNIDERHYNALYGIGQVLQKQEKFVLAQSHFRTAIQIHPLNSTLHYHLGVALAAAVNAGTGTEYGQMADTTVLLPALAELETAANLDPYNPVPKFERAKLLVAMNRLPDARRQLKALRDALPKEAEVHYELSRVCKHMGDKEAALSCLTVALDIEPKERRYKKALESLSAGTAVTTGVL